MKKLYSSPRLIIHGNVEDVTRGNAKGSHLDRTFVEGTPGEDLTFSGPNIGDYDPDA